MIEIFFFVFVFFSCFENIVDDNILQIMQKQCIQKKDVVNIFELRRGVGVGGGVN